MRIEDVVQRVSGQNLSPAGKLTSEQICAGYVALKKIEDCLKQKAGHRQLLEACNQFYTRIPHDFGSVPRVWKASEMH